MFTSTGLPHFLDIVNTKEADPDHVASKRLCQTRPVFFYDKIIEQNMFGHANKSMLHTITEPNETFYIYKIKMCLVSLSLFGS